MSNTTVKKQNKLLLASLVLILAAATVLVAVTGSANRKKALTPPLDNQTENTGDNGTADGTAGEKAPVKQDENASEKVGGNDTELAPEEKPDENDGEKDEKASAPVSDSVEVSAEPEVLPVFSAPVDGIVIKGASLVTPVFSYTMNDYRTHGGLDFACSPGTPVCAAADGTVSDVTDDPMMGVCVTLEHSGGAETTYKGLAEETIGMHSVGDEVSSGDVIGVSGDTALIESAEESHVHFGLSVNGEAKDPAEYVSVVFLSDLTED